mmetsp:Transcript_2324/g.3696  ORF Transcript_2324/g.3696 Transcript_2324/m.3696 type:complete len:289 (-) Transcript_2324:27-893(-)
MPWFFISSLVESSSCPNLPESFLLKFSHCFPSVSESEVQDFVCLLAWHPLKVSLEFLNALRPVASSPHETLNPLRVFQVLKLDSPSTVDIAVSILEVLLAAWEHYVLTYKNQVSQESRHSFILTMQSACVQQLFDNLGTDSQVDRAICDFLHGYWIENPILIKLVHYQGYPLDLLPVAVDKIGSLICTWDFIMDLVQQGSSCQKKFALTLAGHLSIKYPTQKMLDILRSCIQYIEDHINFFVEEKEFEYILDLYVQAFPQLNGRCRKLKRKMPKHFFNYSVASIQLIR